MSRRAVVVKHRRIAPRLASGEHRVNPGNGLPPIVKYALSVIADETGQSRSWVIEQILVQWAEGDPRLHKMLKGAIAYVPRKTDTPALNADEAGAQHKREKAVRR